MHDEFKKNWELGFFPSQFNSTCCFRITRNVRENSLTVQSEFVVLLQEFLRGFQRNVYCDSDTCSYIRLRSLLGHFAHFLREGESDPGSILVGPSKAYLPHSPVFQRHSDLGNAWLNNGHMFGRQSATRFCRISQKNQSENEFAS